MFHKLLLIAALHNFTHTQAVVQDPLADTQTLRGAFQQLVICQEFQALLQREDLGADQPQGLVRAGGTHIGQLLPLTHIHIHIFVAAADTHYHTGIYRGAGTDEQRATLLCGVQTVGDGLAGLVGK